MPPPQPPSATSEAVASPPPAHTRPRPQLAETTPTARPPGPAWWRVLRTRQWTKNLLVLAAPLAAGSLLRVDVALGAGVALALFCLASSGCYLVNDVLDAEQDRRHPVKRTRPVAAGEIGPRAALLAGVALQTVAIVAGALWDPALGATMAAYSITQALYVAGLKHQPPIDLAVVASGFLLRAVAGGAATDTRLSTWFLLLATFGAFFVVAGKRYSERVQVGSEAGTRPSLRHYSESYLRFVWTMAAGVTVVVYLLWALTGPHHTGVVPWEGLSVVAFVLGLLRYAARIDQATAEHPEDIVASDRGLQVVGVIWVLLVLAGAVVG